MLGGGLWNDYGACELEYNDALLVACQQHRLVVYFSSHHIFFQYTSFLSEPDFVLIPLASSHLAAGGGIAAATCGPGRGQKQLSSGTTSAKFQNNFLKNSQKKMTGFLILDSL
jgi:ribosomal protein L18